MLNMLIHYVHRLQLYQADSPLRIIQVSNFFLNLKFSIILNEILQCITLKLNT